MRTWTAVFSWRSSVAPMIVTVSERKSPPYSPTDECNAMSSFNSAELSLIHKRERRQIVRTSTAIDDAMVCAEREFENLCNRPCDNPL